MIGFKHSIRALNNRNYRLLFTGESVSLIGTWMTHIATGWLVYRMTNSIWLLGLVGFLNQLPVFLVASIGGVLADRWDRRRTLLVTQALAMIHAFLMAGLALTGVITIGQILVLSVFQGLAKALDMPVRQSFLPEIIANREDLPNAIGLNSTTINTARLVGPSIAGILIAVAGEGICFLLDGISYIAAIVTLLAIKVNPTESKRERHHILRELKEGLIYTFGFVPIRSILLLLALVSLVGVPYTVLMPVFAREILHGGPNTLGFLMGAAGVGALSAALYLVSRRTAHGLEKTIMLAATMLGIGLVALSFSRVLWVSLVFMLLAGFGTIAQAVSSNMVIQMLVDDDKRGRVMSFHTMAFMGMTPFGSLLAGGLASKLGVPGTLCIGGVCCILGALLFGSRLTSLRQMIYPIYAKKGMVPDVGSGVETIT